MRLRLIILAACLGLTCCTSMQLQPYLRSEVSPQSPPGRIAALLDNHGRTVQFDDSGATIQPEGGQFVVAGTLASGDRAQISYDSVVEFHIAQERMSESRTDGLLVGGWFVALIIVFTILLFQQH